MAQDQNTPRCGSTACCRSVHCLIAVFLSDTHYHSYRTIRMYEMHEGLANVNMYVTLPIAPAQYTYFHLLRRQMKRNFRRPLIVVGPKGVIRIPVRSLTCLLYTIAPSLTHSRQAAASSLEELAPGSKFHPVLDDPSTVSRVALLSGKLYLLRSRQRARCAWSRCPRHARMFPATAMRDVLAC